MNSRHASGESELVRKLSLTVQRLQHTYLVTGLTAWEWRFATDEMIWTAGRPNLNVLGETETMKYSDVVSAVHPDDQQRLIEAGKVAIETSEPFREEFRVLLPNGTLRWTLSRGTVIHDASGKPSHMLGVNTDITERKILEQALRDSEELFRASFESAPIGIAQLSPGGKFSLTNEKFCEMFGYSSEEFKQLKMIDTISPEYREEANESRDRLIAGSLSHYESTRNFIRKDRSTFAGNIVVTVVRDENGGPNYLIVIVSDMTKVQNAMESAKAASIAKSQFLANMSHEIRTPLAAVIGYAELLKRPNTSASSREKYVNVIIRNGKVLSGLISDVLDLSKVEAEKMELETLPIDLEEFLTETANVIDSFIGEKDVSVQLVLPDNLSQTIYTDPTRLRQILMNLGTNAVKFTEKGTVTLALKIHASKDLNRALLEFEVSDTGIGIEKKNQPLLFKAFSQLDASTTRKHGGTGLGLALSKRLALCFGGNLICAESTVGVGSTFVATIPVGIDAAFREECPTIVDKKTQSSIEGINILVVEDSEDLRTYLKLELSQAGAHVDLAENGLEALEMVSGGNYSIILMDIQMPFMDGLETTKVLRRQGFKKPIIALSAHAMNSAHESSLKAGCNQHISKPVSFEELMNSIAACLEKNWT